MTLHLVPRASGYPVPFSERIERETRVPTPAAGFITAAHHAEGYPQSGACDVVALAREVIWNPNGPVHAAAAIGVAKPHGLLPPPHAW